MAVDPKFFQTRQQDQLDLGMFMQAALEARRQNLAASQAQADSRPVGGTIAPQAPTQWATPMSRPQPLLSSNALTTIQNLRGVAAKRTPQDQAQSVEFQKTKYLIDKEQAFNKALAEGRDQDAAAIDPLKYADYQEKKQSLASQGLNDAYKQQLIQASQAEMARAANKIDTNNPYSKADAEAAVKRMQGYKEATPQLQEQLRLAEQAEAAYGRINTGIGGEWIYPNYRALFGSAEDIADENTIRSYQANKIFEATKYLKPISVDELKYAKDIAPGLLTSEKGGQLIARRDQLILKRALAKGRFIDDYTQRNGNTPEAQKQAEDMWNEYVENNKIMVDPTNIEKGFRGDANIDNPMAYFAQKELARRRNKDKK